MDDACPLYTVGCPNAPRGADGTGRIVRVDPDPAQRLAMAAEALGCDPADVPARAEALLAEALRSGHV